jgi:hypothetical protein
MGRLKPCCPGRRRAFCVPTHSVGKATLARPLGAHPGPWESVGRGSACGGGSRGGFTRPSPGMRRSAAADAATILRCVAKKKTRPAGLLGEASAGLVRARPATTSGGPQGTVSEAHPRRVPASGAAPERRVLRRSSACTPACNARRASNASLLPLAPRSARSRPW